MISLIIGNKGSGKTKRLITMVNEAVSKSDGNVVCIEKSLKLTYDLTHKARLVNVDEYGISGFDVLYGFISGMCAANYDLTDLFIDATLRIGGDDTDELVKFMEKLAKLAARVETKFVLTISRDENDLPKELFNYASKI